MRGLCNDINQSLLLDNVLCGRSFSSVNNVEGHACALLQRFETFGLNCGMMYKYIRTAILLNKTKTFRIIKPLYCTFSHLELLLTVRGSLQEPHK